MSAYSPEVQPVENYICRVVYIALGEIEHSRITQKNQEKKVSCIIWYPNCAYETKKNSSWQNKRTIV